MNRGPDVSLVRGSRSRYSCRTVADVDGHLRGIRAWLRRNLPAMTGERQARILAQYRVDLDALLDARIMLAALATLEDDLGELFRGRTPQGPEVVSRAL
jgi:hypothetical protein